MADEPVLDVRQTSCPIVGGGPGGAVLALLLARRGIPVTLLEAHKDFERDFRGDTIHPTVLRILDEVGLVDRVLELPHGKQRGAVFQAADGPVPMIDFRRAGGRWPYIVMMPQARFLELISQEAQRYPVFRLVMGADVRRLIDEGGTIRGVRYLAEDGWHELRAVLTMGADGRFSRVRHLAGMRAIPSGEPPMDVPWFRLPKEASDPQESATGRWAAVEASPCLAVRRIGRLALTSRRAPTRASATPASKPSEPRSWTWCRGWPAAWPPPAVPRPAALRRASEPSTAAWRAVPFPVDWSHEYITGSLS
jgi:2-polyprenyl-6-methoxyphenol hydroxylase-like FAD-dependent oxidoreductase